MDVAELIHDPRLTAFQRACLMDIHALVQERGGATGQIAHHDRSEDRVAGEAPAVEIRIPECGIEVWLYGEGARFRKGALDVRPAIWDFPSVHQLKKYFIGELARHLTPAPG